MFCETKRVKCANQEYPQNNDEGFLDFLIIFYSFLFIKA